MKKPKFIGLAQNCLGSPFESHKENLGKPPHAGQHSNFTYKDFQDSYVTNLKYFRNCFNALGKQFQEKLACLIFSLQQLQKEIKKTIKQQFYRNTHKNDILEKRFVNIVQLLIEDETTGGSDSEDELTCSDIHHFLSNITTNQLRNHYEKSIKNLKLSFHGKINTTIENYQSLNDANARQMFDESIIHPKKLEDNTNFLEELANFQVKNNQHCSVSKEKKIPVPAMKKVYVRKEKPKEKQQTKQQVLPKKQLPISPKPQNYNNNTDDSFSLVINHRGQILGERKSQQINTIQESSTFILASPIKKGKRIDVRTPKVKDLLDGKKFIPQSTIFEIKLKVVKQIFFRIFKDGKSQKYFNKVKFIAGDETGIIVCYSDFKQFIKAGSTIFLSNCQVYHYNESSLQIKCDDEVFFVDQEAHKVKQVSKKLALSRLNPKTLEYNDQGHDKNWKSIRGIAYSAQWLNPAVKEIRRLALVAKIVRIDFYDKKEKIFYFRLGDPTGEIQAEIKNVSFGKYKAKHLKEGQMVYIDEMTVFIKEDHKGKKTLRLSNFQSGDYMFVPKIITHQMAYDDLCEQDASDILAELLSKQNQQNIQ